MFQLFKFLYKVYIVNPNYNVVFDPYIQFPEGQNIINNLKARNYIDFSKAYLKLDSLHQSAIVEVASFLDLSLFEDWQKVDSSYLPKLFLGSKYFTLAKNARGGHTFDKLSNKQIDGLQHYTDLARNILLDIATDDATDCMIFNLLINLEMMSGQRSHLLQYYKMGKKLEPNNKGLLRNMTLASTRKWGGSRQELLDFMDQNLNTLDKLDIKLVGVAEDLMANNMIDRDDAEYLPNSEKIKYFNSVFETEFPEFESKNPEITFENALTYSNMAFVYTLIGKNKQALEIVNKVGNKMKKGLWIYFSASGPNDVYTKVVS
jgi:hypothetical protein